MSDADRAFLTTNPAIDPPLPSSYSPAVTMTNLFTISSRDLKRAITLKTRIERLEAELATLLGDSAPPAAAAPPRRRRMSAAARARIAAAARARWARVRAGKGRVARTAAKGGRRKLNAAARAAISARLKARWAKVKRGGSRSLKEA